MSTKEKMENLRNLSDKELALLGLKRISYDEIQSINPNSLELTVTDILVELGIPANIKGYTYARTGIIMCVNTPEMINSITKELYPAIAMEHNTTPGRVERAIRHAIETSFYRGNYKLLNSFFGSCINSSKGKATNSEFIATISDRIRVMMK